MSNLYSDPLMDAFYQVWVHLVKRFQRKRFLILTNQKKELPMAPCLFTDRANMSNRYRESIDSNFQVSAHLAERFPRRRLRCEKLTDDRRRTPSDGKVS
jgi:hypothetical protein